MERNTYATSLYIEASLTDVSSYLVEGDSLSEYTLFSRMEERIDAATWRGTASGYQASLFYHAKRRTAGPIEIVEWHCGTELGRYYHVYPMLLIPPTYFGSVGESGTYYHWISFVDPARTTPMITQGLPTVHRSEARALKAHVERRAGRREPGHGRLVLHAHTIFVDASVAAVAGYLSDPAAAAEWGYPLLVDGRSTRDAYGHALAFRITAHDLGDYRLIEHDTLYAETGVVVRAPMLLIPAAYAFAQPDAAGTILHRLSAWPVEGGPRPGKAAPDDYDTEAINAKRIIEARVGNLGAYARGCSYRAPESG